jgi:4-hydroxy-2-oxovalerate aldolase
MNKNAKILDCTLRDGTYVANFSKEEIEIITNKLSISGIEYIEVGHGVGLGYYKKKEGAMTDEVFISSARNNLRNNAKLGVFFIPGIGDKDDIAQAKELGIDFIRIGTNASDYSKAFPFIEFAKEQGLEVFYNSMKSYILNPFEFTKSAKEIEKIGADGIYLVDSAGGMFPNETEEYIKLLRENIQCKIGFHGHNNLMLANANVITAIENGADLVDTTLMGLGRGGGNAPTEIVLYILDKLGVENTIDNKEILKLTKDMIFQKSSTSYSEDYDIDIISGFAMFHSGFLETFTNIAKNHKVDLRDLIIKVSAIEKENPSEELIMNIAKEIKGSMTQVFSPRSIN